MRGTVGAAPVDKLKARPGWNKIIVSKFNTSSCRRFGTRAPQERDGGRCFCEYASYSYLQETYHIVQ